MLPAELVAVILNASGGFVKPVAIIAPVPMLFRLLSTLTIPFESPVYLV